MLMRFRKIKYWLKRFWVKHICGNYPYEDEM